MPTFVVVVIVSAFSAYHLSLRFATEAYDTALFDSARSLAQQIEIGPDEKPVLNLTRAVREIIVSDPYDRIYYKVTGRDGSTLAGNAEVPPPRLELTRDYPVRFYDGVADGEHVRVGAYGLFATGDAPAATVLFAETLVKRTRLSQRLSFTVLVPLVLLTWIVAALVWYGVRRGLAPLDQLASALSQRGWGDLRAVGHEHIPDEVRPLIESLNNLMTRLGAAHIEQQRFISEAAHQLRTPLAGLTAQTERALLASDVASVKAALAQLQSAARRVTRLVNQLLTLAKAEPGNDPQHDLVSLDLSRLVQETCREWVPEALARNIDLGFAGHTGPLTIVGHEFLLAEMLNNLIDNALRYGAGAGGSITVRLTAAPRVEIAVEDDGPGIPESERVPIFERFHRMPGAAPGGCGLGLPIVRQIAHLHGAEVFVESRPDRSGAVFRVIFAREVPTQPASSATAAG